MALSAASTGPAKAKINNREQVKLNEHEKGNHVQGDILNVRGKYF